MTELEENKLARTIDDMCNAFEDSQKEVGRLERENTQLKAQLTEQTVEKFQEIIRNQCDEISALKAQLTWRPVSEKPEIGQKVICMNNYNMVVRTEYQKEGFVVPGYYSNGDPSHTIEWSFGITHWLPIPPLKEGE